MSMKYTTAFVWSINQFGAGNTAGVQPRNVLENIFTICVVVIALFVVSSTVSTITNWMAQVQMSKTESLEDMDTLRRFCRQHHMPRDVSVRIFRFIKEMQRRRHTLIYLHDVKLVKSLSMPLQYELQFWIYRSYIKNQPLIAHFVRCQPHLIHRLCAEAMNISEFSVDDAVFSAGMLCGAARCIVSGSLAYQRSRRLTTISDERIVLSKRQWLCESALFTSWFHVGTAIAASRSSMLHLEPERFTDVIKSDMAAWRKTADYARHLVLQINEKAMQGRLTDVDKVSLMTGPEDGSRKARYKAQVRRWLQGPNKQSELANNSF